MKRSLSLLAGLLLPTLCLGSVSEELIQQLKSELQAYTAKNPREEGRGDYRMAELLLMLSRSGGEDAENYAAYVEQLVITAPNDKIRVIAEALGPVLKKEQAARDAAVGDELTKTVGTALRQCLEATTAREMDEPLANVSKVLRGNERSSRNNQLQRQFQQAQQAQEVMRQLQNFVAHVSDDESGNGHQRLRNLLSSQYDFSEFIPRSELLEKVMGLEKRFGGTIVKPADVRVSTEEWQRSVLEVLSAVKTLEEMPVALDKVSKMRAPNAGYAPIALQQEMQSLNASYQDILRGQGAVISLSNLRGTSESNATVLAPLRSQLLQFALPRLLQLPAGKEVAKDETTINFLQRQMTQAKAEQDWSLVQRVIDLSQRLNLQVGLGPSDASALSLFLAGSNQERAKQYSLAVASYLATLKTGSQAIPAEHIGDLLARIKQEHPAEFEQGSRPVVETPMSAEAAMRARAGYPPGFPYSGGVPRPDPLDAQTSQRLTVPAAPTASPASTAPSGGAATGAPAPAASAVPGPLPVPKEPAVSAPK